jgi:purine-binding chemotaxis protein CheW
VVLDGRSASLICRVGDLLCAVPLRLVAETMRPLPIEPLAGVPSYVLGVAIIRDRPTAVVDAGALIAGRTGSPSRFVTLRVGDRPVALAVDAVVGIAAVPEDGVHGLPTLLQSPRLAAVSAAGALDGALLLALETARLVPDDVWAAMAAGARPA